MSNPGLVLNGRGLNPSTGLCHVLERERERERERDGVFKILNFSIRLNSYLNCKSSITYIISIVQKIDLNDHDCNKLKGANYIRSTTQINLKCLSLLSCSPFVIVACEP